MPHLGSRHNTCPRRILDSDDSITEGAPELPGAQHEGPAGRRLATNRRGRSRVPAPAGVTHVAVDMGNVPLAASLHSRAASGQVTGSLRGAGSTGAAQGAQGAPGYPSTGLDVSFGPPSFAGKPMGYPRETSQNEPTRSKRSAQDSRRVTGQPDQLDDSVEQAAPKVRVRRSSPPRDLTCVTYGTCIRSRH